MSAARLVRELVATGELIGDRVDEVTYRNAHTRHRGPYVHRFGAGDELYGLADGSLLIRNRQGGRLWGFRTVRDAE